MPTMSLFYTLFVPNSCDDDLQREWDSIETWSRVRKLPLNFLKCCIMNIQTKKNLSMSPIFSSDGCVIRNVDEFSFLGLTFSSDLRWNSYCDKVLRKACKRFYILYNLRRAGFDDV